VGIDLGTIYEREGEQVKRGETAAMQVGRIGRAPSPDVAWRATVARLCCAFAAVAFSSSLAAASSSAAIFSETLCSEGTSAGQCYSPRGVAVDQSGGPGGTSGTVYVVDRNNRRVDVFNTSGRFLMAFGTGVVNLAPELQTCTAVCGQGPELGGFQAQAVAVDQTTHEIYVSEDSENKRYVQKLAFNALSEKFETLATFGGPGSGPGQFNGNLPIAVEASGDVWVGDIDRIQRFSGSGALLAEASLPARGIVQALAVSPAGDLFAITSLNGLQQLAPPASGTYTLTFGRRTTGPLVGGAAAKAGEIEAALTAAYGSPLPLFTVEGPEGGPFTIEQQGSVDNESKLEASAGSVVVTQEGGPARQIDKLSPSGTLLEALDVNGYPQALGIDPATGDLFAGECVGDGAACATPYTISSYAPSGAQLAAFGAHEVIGDPSGNAIAFSDVAQRLYLASSEAEGNSAVQAGALPPLGPLVEGGSTAVSAVRKTAATLNAAIDPEGKETRYVFQYVTQAQFEKNEKEGHDGFTGAATTPLSSPIGSDFAAHEASASLTGLAYATSYRFRVVAYNADNEQGVEGEAASFETLPPASVEASVSDVTASSATFSAAIDPLGEAVSYRFQYIAREAMQRNEEAGEQPFAGAAQAPASEVALGSGEEAVPVSVHVQGLAAHTEYRVRVVIVDAVAPEGFGSAPLAFTTQAQASAVTLPDGRQWELVSPPNKDGALLSGIEGEGVVQAAATGVAITYQASEPTEGEPQGNSGSTQVLSARSAGGWSSHDLNPSHPRTVGGPLGGGTEYRFFSSDLSLGVLQPFGGFEPQLSAEASEQTPYLRSDFAAGGSGFCSQACYKPLLTSADVTSGQPFSPKCSFSEVVCGAKFVGATPDLAHVVLSSGIGLTSAPSDDGGLYEYADGQLTLVSVPPGGVGSDQSAALGFENQVTRGALSADGSRVVWSAKGHLYLRDLVKGETLELDALQGGTGGGQPDAHFQAASEAGSVVYFSDNQPLTADSGAGSAIVNLYECRIEEEAGHLRCALTDLTPLIIGQRDAVEGGAIPGASADGSYAYFVATGDLTGGQGNDRGAHAVAGAPNLYVRHEGTTTFIATLANEDAPDWANHEFDLSELTDRVSPNGLWFAFMSARPLTGYDSRDAVSGEPDEEVFLYHAAGGGSPGRLICASCNPTGARPHGIVDGRPIPGSVEAEPTMPLAVGTRTWQRSDWLAANLPVWTPYRLQVSIYQSRYLSNSGRLFFDAIDALVPQDTNGAVDVYEYEPPAGEGAPVDDGCGEDDSTYVAAAGGCVSLISSGASREESAFIDASESGSDVFFLTQARLSTLDYDIALDVYDAHVCTAESPCPPPPPPPPPACEGDACQSPAVGPEALTPASLTFSGAGNATVEPAPALVPKAKPGAHTKTRPSVQKKRTRSMGKHSRTPQGCKKEKAAHRRAACKSAAGRPHGGSRRARRTGRLSERAKGLGR
jgi:hypothetical protein